MITNNENQFWLCFNKEVDVLKFAEEVYNTTGIKLVASSPEDIVNGYINGYHFKKGYKGECAHGTKLDGTKKHTCLEIILYDSDDTPNYDELLDVSNKLIKSTGHKSDIKKVTITNEKTDNLIMTALNNDLSIGGIVSLKKVI